MPAGLPFYEKPYNGEEIDPYIYDGYMSIEDYELMHQKIEQERSEHLAEQFSILIDSRSRFETGQPVAYGFLCRRLWSSFTKR